MKDSHLQNPKASLAYANPNICGIAEFHVQMITVALPYPCTIVKLTCHIMRNTKCSNFTVIYVMITFAQTQVKYTAKHQKIFCRVLVLVLNRTMD